MDREKKGMIQVLFVWRCEAEDRLVRSGMVNDVTHWATDYKI
jgi:hypothetical protein